MTLPGPYDQQLLEGELPDRGNAARRGGARRGAGRPPRRRRRPDHQRRQGLNGLRDREAFEANREAEIAERQRRSRRERRERNRTEAESAELEELASNGIILVSSGIPRAPRVTFLSNLQLTWGEYWTNLELAFKQKMVKLLISTFSHNYFQLIDADDFLVELWYAVAAMLKHSNRDGGGNFTTGYAAWASIETQLKQDINPLTETELYIPITDSVLQNNPFFLVTVSDKFSDEFFRNHVATITQTVKMLDNYILKNLELILYPASVFQDIMRIQNPQHASVTSPFMGYILECLKKCFAHKFLCLNCCMSFPSLQKTLSHCNSKHNSYINQDVYVATIDQRTERALRRERETYTRQLLELQATHEEEMILKDANHEDEMAQKNALLMRAENELRELRQ